MDGKSFCELRRENPLIQRKLKATCTEDDIARLMNTTNYLYDFYHEELFTPAEPLSVIIHGDFHMWNIAFDGHSQAVKFFDLQVSRYASPMIDVHHYLAQTTTAETRRKHLDEFLAAYQTGFNDTLRRLNSAQEHLKRGDILKEYKRVSPWGLLMGVDWILYRFVVDQDSFAEVEKQLKIDASKRDNGVIVEYLQKSGPKIWLVIQIIFDLIGEMKDLETFENIENFKNRV